jgi:hypothetical protein
MNEDIVDSIMFNEGDDEIIRDFMYWDTAAGNAVQCLEGSFVYLKNLDMLIKERDRLATARVRADNGEREQS